MPREKESYRDNLESILAFTGGRHVLCTKEVMAYCGKSRGFVLKTYGIKDNAISAETLARRLS